MPDPRTWQQVADLHASSLDQGFLATLGLRFLALMYRAIDECESSILLVEERNNQVIGFVTGAHSMGPIYRQMFRSWPQLFLAMLPSLLSPRRLWRIFEILRYSKRQTMQPNIPAYELLSIAVDPSVRGQGVAERLYKSLVNHCREHNIPAFRIVVGEELAPAHKFYRRMGAVVVTEIAVHKEERSLVYVQEV